MKPGIRKPRSAPEYRIWSDELDNQVLSLRQAGETWEAISNATGRPGSACADRYYTALDPGLREWTPAMFAKLDQLVEDGYSWMDIARILNQRVVACQHQWRNMGKGQYRLKTIHGRPQGLKWSTYEIETYWSAWLKCGGMNWTAIAQKVRSKDAKECQDMFRTLVVSAVKDAPGWAKLDTVSYLADTARIARSRKRNQNTEQDVNEVLEEASEDKDNNDKSDNDGSLSAADPSVRWTPAEHQALLAAVEKYGLFSGWEKIRDRVKPDMTEDEVEAEYYRLNGVSMQEDPTSTADQEQEAKAELQDGDWTKKEVERLNLILMKYSSLNIWKEEAAKHNVKPSDEDYHLFRDNPNDNFPVSYYLIHRRTRIDNSPWDKERIDRLKRLVAQQQHQERASRQPVNWEWIAEHIGADIDANMCITQWQRIEHTSIRRFNPAQFWFPPDIKALEKGVLKYGRAWSLISREFLPHRSVDSVRRKLTNLQHKRDAIMEAVHAEANNLKVDNPDLDVEAYVRSKTLRDKHVIQAKRFEDLLEAYDRRTEDENMKSASQDKATDV
ncbi:hypothetical protein EDD11_004319 [Mortierella claussenii]|nr:hypothetical protein EDD11_004319 [Mortierella claussenii]